MFLIIHFIHFLFFIFSNKNVKYLCKLSKCFGYPATASRIYPLSLSLSQFFMKPSTNLDTFFFQLKTIYRQFLRHCPYIQIVCIYIHEIWWLYVLIISRVSFRVNPHSIVTWISRNSLLEAGMEDHLGRNQALNQLA